MMLMNRMELQAQEIDLKLHQVVCTVYRKIARVLETKPIYLAQNMLDQENT
jgi:hypothetical protein